MDIEIGQQLEVTAERLAPGGDAVCRHEGVMVFVPFAAPGDRLRVRVTSTGKRLCATIEAVLEPSPLRREPRCPLFGECGGCHFQHVDYGEQLRQKGEFVRDALQRIGGFDWTAPIDVHHAAEWGYRSRTQLNVYRRKLGFNRVGGRETVDVTACPVMAPELSDALPRVRAALAELPLDQLPHQLDGACGTGGAVFAPDLPGMRKDLVEHRVGGFSYLVEPESFFQGNRLLVEELAKGVLGDQRGRLCYDLFAGVGLFSLPLSRRFEQVIAVEDERRAVLLGRVNARHNGCPNVAYVRAPVEGFLDGAQERPDLVVMDPPRLGARSAIPGLLALRAERLVYVSCDPGTLARDLKELCAGGYLLEGVEAYDMFPQTWHIESIARLSWSG